MIAGELDHPRAARAVPFASSGNFVYFNGFEFFVVAHISPFKSRSD